MLMKLFDNLQKCFMKFQRLFKKLQNFALIFTIFFEDFLRVIPFKKIPAMVLKSEIKISFFGGPKLGLGQSLDNSWLAGWFNCDYIATLS